MERSDHNSRLLPARSPQNLAKSLMPRYSLSSLLSSTAVTAAATTRSAAFSFSSTPNYAADLYSRLRPFLTMSLHPFRGLFHIVLSITPPKCRMHFSLAVRVNMDVSPTAPANSL